MTLSSFRAITTTLLGLAVLVPCHAELRISPSEALKAAVRKVAPEYNSIARQLKVEGEVEVEARVSATGEVTEVVVTSGNALLTANVIKAVRDWRFQPFQEKGKASQAIATLRFAFKL